MSRWHADELDLDRYLARIGFRGTPGADIDSLRRLHRGHTTSIPFENLDVITGRGVPLDVASLQRKLVDAHRGGYCFEHATLFAAVLERIGFRFTALTGRVTLGADPVTRPGTHALLVVEFNDGTRHLCDVGFGRGPLEPIPLDDCAQVDQSGWRFHLVTEKIDDLFDTDRLILRQWSGEWVDRHAFTLNPQFPIDFRVGNHFVSTSPRSPFTARTFVQRFGQREHHTLDGLTWTTAGPDGVGEVRTVAPTEIPGLLDDVFGIGLDAADAAAVVDVETRRIAAGDDTAHG